MQFFSQGNSGIQVLNGVLNDLKEEYKASDSSSDNREVTNLEMFYALTSDFLRTNEETTTKELDMSHFVEENETLKNLSSSLSSLTSLEMLLRKHVSFKHHSDFCNDA